MSRNKIYLGNTKFPTDHPAPSQIKIPAHSQAPQKGDSFYPMPSATARTKFSTHHHKYYLLSEIRDQGCKNKRNVYLRNKDKNDRESSE